VAIFIVKWEAVFEGFGKRIVAVGLDHGDANCGESKNPHPGILRGSLLNLVLHLIFDQIEAVSIRD
jgi:hypothetical protein